MTTEPATTDAIDDIFGPDPEYKDPILSRAERMLSVVKSLQKEHPTLDSVTAATLVLAAVVDRGSSSIVRSDILG